MTHQYNFCVVFLKSSDNFLEGNMFRQVFYQIISSTVIFLKDSVCLLFAYFTEGKIRFLDCWKMHFQHSECRSFAGWLCWTVQELQESLRLWLWIECCVPFFATSQCKNACNGIRGMIKQQGVSVSLQYYCSILGFVFLQHILKFF